jgi:hypothetical protein
VSNFLAPATVSAALQLLLTDAVTAAVGGANIWIDRSDVKRQTAGVNIYLYRTTFDPVWRNEELPARRSDATLRTRPKVALALHYLFTFHGKDDEMVPQRLLGATAAALHSRPVLTRALIDQVVAEATAHPPNHPFLATSDLADAEEVVRVCPEPLDLEEMSKLWSVFFQTPYQLSASYVASAVLIEEPRGTVIPSPPVLVPQLTVRPLLLPTILTARNATDPRAPLVSDAVLLITGSGLRGDETHVRVGGAELVPADTDVTATSVRMPLTGAVGLQPGLQPVVVVQRWLVGDPAQPRQGETSNAVGALVAPKITASVSAGHLNVVSDLPNGPRQEAGVTLLVPATGATARQIAVADRTDDVTTVTVPLAGVPPGQYGVVLGVDGATSPVTRNVSGVITAPLVTVP